MFFFHHSPRSDIYTLSLHDALPIYSFPADHFDSILDVFSWWHISDWGRLFRSEEHTSELQLRLHLVCRLLLEKKNVFGYYYSSYFLYNIVMCSTSEDDPTDLHPLAF